MSLGPDSRAQGCPEQPQAGAVQAVSRRRTLPGIQCLRALVASGVVFLHAQMEAERFSATAPLISADLANFGNYGVDLFFVISGFVIYYTNSPRPLSAMAFFRRRAWRIVPLYGLLTLLAFSLRRMLPESWFVALPPSLTDLAVSITFLSGHRPIIGVGWTLEFEMLFYGCTAVAIAFLARRWSLVAYALVAFALVGQVIPAETGVLKALMDPLLLEFVLGLIAAEIYCSGRMPVAKLAALGVVLLLLWQQSESVIRAGLPATLLVYAAARFGTDVPLKFGRRVCCALGDASYSIYLIQFFTLPVIGRALGYALQGQYPNALLLVGFFGTLVGGYVCYRFVERPLLAWGGSPGRAGR